MKAFKNHLRYQKQPKENFAIIFNKQLDETRDYLAKDKTLMLISLSTFLLAFDSLSNVMCKM